MSTPDADVVSKLAGASISGVGSDTCFAGPEDGRYRGLADDQGGLPTGTTIPAAAATFVTTLGGRSAHEYFGSARKRIDEYTVQVLCRGLPHDPTEPKTRARACMAALHRASLTGYMVQGCMTDTEPNYLGADDAHRFRYAFTARLWKEITP